MTPPPNHTRFIVGCVTLMGMSAALTGAWLLWKGFAGGGELVVTLNTAISGLVGYLGGRAMPASPATTATTSTIADDGAVVTTITNPEPEPPRKPKAK